MPICSCPLILHASNCTTRFDCELPVLCGNTFCLMSIGPFFFPACECRARCAYACVDVTYIRGASATAAAATASDSHVPRIVVITAAGWSVRKGGGRKKLGR